MLRDLARSGIACAIVLGCGGRIPLEEVPDQPLALMRQEAAKGLSSVEEFGEALRIPNPEEPSTLKARRTTTLVLMNIPTGEIRPVPGMKRGSLPLDWSSDGYRLLVGSWDGGQNTFRLLSWNRVTGAVDRVDPERTSGTASLGPVAGPIRLAVIGRRRIEGGIGPLGVRLMMQRAGLRDMPDGAPGNDPDVAPDGRTVVFERPSSGLQRDGVILLARLGEGRQQPLGRGTLPRFSRDGKWITFLRRRDGQTDVWLMRADGTGKKALTNTSFDEEYPAVSAHGRFVAFSSVRPPGEESQIYLIRVDDGAESQLTRGGQHGRPRW